MEVQTNPIWEKYKEIYRIMYDSYYLNGMTRDKASRLANIFAVQNTWSLYNEERE